MGDLSDNFKANQHMPDTVSVIMASAISPSRPPRITESPPTSCGTICLHNQTAIPLVYIISQLSPLYWGVIQPGEWVQRRTGPFWFTVTTLPYCEDNVPTTCGVVFSHIRDICGFLFAAATVGSILTSTAEDELINGWAAYMAGAVAGKLTGEMIVRECCKSDLGGEWNMVRERGVFAGGRWIYIQGGPREGGVRGGKMVFSREIEREMLEEAVEKERRERLEASRGTVVRCGQC